MQTKEVTLHDKQYKAFLSERQYIACISGVQSGKTFLGAYWSADKIAKFPDKNGLICAPTVKILQQSTLAKFFEEFPQYRQFYKEQKGQIEIPGGKGTIFVRSMDNPFGVEGMTVKWAWLDEAGQMPSMAWTVIRSRTAINRGQVFITTTPYNMGWLYQNFYLPWKDGTDPDMDVYSWASVDSPYFPPEFYEKEKQRLSKEEFNRRYCGEFTRMQGLVYELHNWHKTPISALPQRFDAVIGGMDWGYTNPAALSVLGLYKGVWYFVDEWYEVGKTTPEIIQAAKELQRKWGVTRWYADSANPEKIQEASYQTGLYIVPCEKLKDSLGAGISTINQLLKENRMFVAENCKNAFTEFEAYHYPELIEGKIQKEDPVPEDNHLMDAMRYTIMGYMPVPRYEIPKIKVNPVNALLSREMENESKGTSYE